MRIAVAQINTSVGDFKSNKKKILANIGYALSSEADLIVFPECTTTGYPQKDLLYNSAFIDENLQLVKDICKYSLDTARGLTIVLGFVDRNSLTGNLYNSAAVIEDGAILGTYDKQLLPNYTVFDERRYFTPGTRYPVFKKNGIKFAVTICEDAWDDSYKVKPFKEFKGQHPDLNFILNICASPFSIEKYESRYVVISRRVLDTKDTPVFYINQVGAQDSLIFDGNSFLVTPGVRYATGSSFIESTCIVNYDPTSKSATIESNLELGVDIENRDIYQALILGIKDYFTKTGFSKAVIGLSGGIDSAVVCALAVRALGKENVTGILMPSRYSSKHSITDALALAKNLGIKTYTIPIKDAVLAYNKTLSSTMGKYTSDVTEQNIQARIRGNILMAFANEIKGTMVLSTGNKSEMSVGYCTLYGDMCGGLSVLADVYKTKVYALAECINSMCYVSISIPINTITKPPSAELKPGQQDTDSLPPYDVLDAILIRYLENKESYEEIIKDSPHPLIVKKILKMVDNNEFKRQQSAPGLIITERDLTTGRRMPIANRF